VLGTFLFVLYTAGLISLIESHGLSPHLYADDTQACRCRRTLSVDLRVHGCRRPAGWGPTGYS